jgi:hypothetical protein
MTWIAWVRQIVVQDDSEATRVRKQDANASGHLDCFFNVVSHHEDALQIGTFTLP